MHPVPRRRPLACRSLVAICLVACAPSLQAANQAATLDDLRGEIAALRTDYEARLAALETRLAALAEAPPPLAVAPPEPTPLPPSLPPPGTGGAAQPANYFNPAISLTGSFLAVGGSNAIEGLPSAEMRESELGLQAAIDPYARADAFLAFGEEGVELEEGYVTFTALPAKLLLKVGRMRTAFGKVNTMHSHTLPWPDLPLHITNLLGPEGWLGTGVSVGRLVPLPRDTFSELTLQVFRGDAEDLFVAAERADLAYNARYRVFRDLSDSTNLDLGVSHGLGPNGHTSSSTTALSGFDATFRWKPPQTGLYRSATFRGELFRSRREGELDTQTAWGGFVAADYQLARRWATGIRYEESERAAATDQRDTGLALLLTFKPSEFSTLRSELRRRRYAEGETADELLLQLQFAIGAHGAHPF